MLDLIAQRRQPARKVRVYGRDEIGKAVSYEISGIDSSIWTDAGAANSRFFRFGVVKFARQRPVDEAVSSGFR